MTTDTNAPYATAVYATAYTTINSRLYAHLFEQGTVMGDGDALVSVYCHLKAFKKGRVKYKNPKGLSHYGLLRKETNLSLVTLKRYLPKLIELGLCYFDVNGDFVLLGNNKINRLFEAPANKRRKNYHKDTVKLVKIKIGRNLAETKTNSFFLRIYSDYNSQQKAIAKKQNRKNIRERAKSGKFLTKSEKSILKMIEERGLQDELTNDQICLSQHGFARIKTNGESFKEAVKNKEPKIYSSKGYYWREKLKRLKLIQTERQFTYLGKTDFYSYRLFRRENPALRFESKTGKMYEEQASKFQPYENKEVVQDRSSTNTDTSTPTLSKKLFKDSCENYVSPPHLNGKNGAIDFLRFLVGLDK